MKNKNGEHPFGDAGQLILFLIFMAVWIADSFSLHRSTFLARHIPLAVRLVLLALAIFTAWFLFRSASALIRHGQRQGHVFKSGAFHYVRHPLYLGVLFIYLGMIIATASLYSLAAFAAIFLFYNYIAGYEEKLMEGWTGEAYKSYKKRTGRWLPKFHGNK
ncbi:MAG: methyltransferase family protein [Candidatus Aminicenantales bacterium]